MAVAAISGFDRNHRRPEIDRVGGDAAAEPLGRVDRAVMVEMVEDEGEKVAADPGEHVARADQPAQHLGDMDQGRVAGKAAAIAACG